MPVAHRLQRYSKYIGYVLVVILVLLRQKSELCLFSWHKVVRWVLGSFQVAPLTADHFCDIYGSQDFKTQLRFGKCLYASELHLSFLQMMWFYGLHQSVTFSVRSGSLQPSVR